MTCEATSLCKRLEALLADTLLRAHCWNYIFIHTERNGNDEAHQTGSATSLTPSCNHMSARSHKTLFTQKQLHNNNADDGSGAMACTMQRTHLVDNFAFELGAADEKPLVHFRHASAK
jgi:hypothetical protein